MIVSLVTGWTTLFADSSISIGGDVGSSPLLSLYGIDHSGVSNIALPRDAYNACREILTSALVDSNLVACRCSLGDLRPLS